MSVWGMERSFSEGALQARVLSLVETDGFAAATGSDPVAELYLVEILGGEIKIAREGGITIHGPLEQSQKLLARLRERYVGKPYREWCQNVG